MSLLEQLSDAPQWLLDCSIEQPRAASPASGALAGGMFSHGRRHKDFVSQAGLMRRNGASVELIEAMLLSTNAMLADPLPDSEIRSIAYSMNRYEPSHIESLTHKSFAEFMVQDLAGRCLYCVGDGFYFYKDNIWQRDNEGLYVLDCAVELTDKLIAQVEQMKAQLSDDEYKSLKKAVRRTQDTPFLSNATKQFKAKASIRVTFDEMNAQKHLINFSNCTYNLKTGKAEQHSADHRFTWKLDFDFDEKAECPVFDKFLDDILTKPVQRLLLQLIACSLTANDREQVFVFLQGETQNGKSTLVKILQSLFTALSATVEPSSLMVKAGEHIPNDLARLAGKRFVFTSETKLGNIIDAPLLKRMTGRDTLTVRFMRAEYFEYTPEFIPFIITNYLPVIDGTDIALKRRMVIIPFDRIIPNDKVDKGLKNKLLHEKAGIFNRIIAAWKDYESNGSELAIPQEIYDRVDKYVDGSNLMKRFFEEKIELDEKSQIGARELHHWYTRWSEGYKVKPLSEPQFKLSFERSTGILQHYNSRNRYWPGIKLR